MGLRISGKTWIRAAAAIALAAGLGQGGARAEDTVKLGFTGALTGPYNEFGEGLRRGITIAVEEWNKRGGVDGRKVEFMEPLDDQLVPDRAVQNMRRLLDNKDIAAFVAPSGSGPTLAVVDMVAADGRPMCNAQAQTPAIVYPNGRDKPPRPNVFSVALSNAVEGERLGRALAAHYNSVGVLHESTGYGVTGAELVKKEITAANGAVKVTTEAYNQRAQDVTAQLVRLQRAGVAVIQVIGLGADFAVIRKNMARLNIALPLYGSAGAMTPPYVEGAGDLAIGTYGPAAISMGMRPMPAEAQKFADLYRSKYGLDRWYGPVTERPQLSLATAVASGYDCANVLLDGIRRAHSTAPDAVIKALDATANLPGVSVQSISFTPENHVALKMSDLGIYQLDKHDGVILFDLVKE